ncbi:MAG: three-Cys-motif partner protein TcmP [Bacteroidetes bacterium]|nr:three-Cys-motif partner protein TcmP [Bacteroidota bacterium]
MVYNSFFEEITEQSQAKTQIVSKYFWAWSKVIIPRVKKHGDKIGYIDLFAGPGRYQDGTSSTPLIVLEKAISEKDIRNRLVTIFNDKDPNNVSTLKKEVQTLPGVTLLKYEPQVYNLEVGNEIANIFESIKLIPSLLFIDPWGYKGLSLKLIQSVLRNWGCDIIFFFNYNRINPGISNPAVKERMNSIFGSERVKILKGKLNGLGPRDREFTILEELAQALKEIGGDYVLPFTFYDEKGSRTSHHLVFVTKNILGYDIMKDIMARESTSSEQGVPTFRYNPSDKRYIPLFELNHPLDYLSDMLLKNFKGRTLSMKEIYFEHNVGKNYVRKNYKDVLIKLESNGKIVADPSAVDRRKGTFGDNVKVTFPL